MEEEIKPKIISTIDTLSKYYLKLIKYQNEKLNCVLAAKEFSRSKDKAFKDIQNKIVGMIKSLQLNPSILEDLVREHYQENKKIVSLEGLLMRSAMENKIPIIETMDSKPINSSENYKQVSIIVLLISEMLLITLLYRNYSSKLLF